MNSAYLKKYAALIVEYCVSVQNEDKVYIKSTTLAEPLVREVMLAAYKAGALLVEVDFSVKDQQSIFLENASSKALSIVSPLYKTAIETFDCYIYIRAPYQDEYTDLKEYRDKIGIRKNALKDLNNLYFERTATRALKRTLCEYPTEAGAIRAGMTLEDYTDFILKACKLHATQPVEGWLEVRKNQQRIVDYLNRCSSIQYLASHTDIRFSTKDRTWINSDGQTNMPSGEVYTSPVEDSVNGHIHFSMDGYYMGQKVSGVTLYVSNGWIENWEATEGKELLDEVFKIEGTRRFGEAAIGTNYNIQSITGNILFDEKMGGTVHMAIGQSYKQCGGENNSSVHWDMITDMTKDGKIFADEKLIYERGQFLI